MSWHKTARVPDLAVAPFPKPGTTWRPLHRKPHRDNKTISIRRFISRAKEQSSAK